MDSYAVIGLFLLFGVVYVGGAIVASRLIAPRGDGAHKHVPYECGIVPTGSARIQFSIGYYLFALVFMVFDVEALFLFPCVKIYRAVIDGNIPGLTGVQVMLEILVFVAILVMGLAFAWRKRALEWQ